jgi:hypothetical protein
MSALKCAIECQSNGLTEATCVSWFNFFLILVSGLDFVVVFILKLSVVFFREGTIPRYMVTDAA